MVAGHDYRRGQRRSSLRWGDLVVLRIVVLRVRAVCNQSPLLVVSPDIHHCTVLVVAVEVAADILHILGAVKGPPEEVDSLDNLVADNHLAEVGPVVVGGHRTVEEGVRILEVEEAHSLVVGEGRSLEGGIVAVVDSYVAAPGRGRRT